MFKNTNHLLLTSASVASTVVYLWFWQGPGKAVVPDSVTSGPELVDWLHRELQQRKVMLLTHRTDYVLPPTSFRKQKLVRVPRG